MVLAWCPWAVNAEDREASGQPAGAAESASAPTEAAEEDTDSADSEAVGQGEDREPADATQEDPGQDTSTDQAFEAASEKWERKLEQSIEQLEALRQQRNDRLVELRKKLSQLEDEMLDAQKEYQKVSGLESQKRQAKSNLEDEIEGRKEVVDYLKTIFGQYADSFEDQLHVAERQIYRPMLKSAREARADKSLSNAEVFTRQVELLDVSIDRLEDVLGGTTFEGQAIDPDDDNTIKDGAFLLIGPAGLFRAADGSAVGTVEQPVDSSKDAAAVVAFADERHSEAAAELIRSREGRFPMDTTLGKAHQIEATEESFVEHLQKGGPVMVPIVGMAGLALLVVLYKWVALMLVPKPSRAKIRGLLDAVGRGDLQSANEQVTRIKGPIGKMLKIGLEHVREPRELIEEVMYEVVLSTRLKVKRLLPFVAIAASSAPLLGLLGTVTGIINTFDMITVHGSGDVKMLSGGIGEALITTKFGLIVAIPSLLLYAFLNRKAKGFDNRMEMTALAFVNEVDKGQCARTDESDAPRQTSEESGTEAGRGEAADATDRAADTPDREEDKAETSEQSTEDPEQEKQ
jgi:biopolymer transport protein ExbB